MGEKRPGIDFYDIDLAGQTNLCNQGLNIQLLYKFMSIMFHTVWKMWKMQIIQKLKKIKYLNKCQPVWPVSLWPAWWNYGFVRQAI